MEIIKRDIYLNRLIERRENGLIKVVTGIRRCGKSYLLFKLYYQYLLASGIDASRIIRIPLDDEEYEELPEEEAFEYSEDAEDEESFAYEDQPAEEEGESI